MKKLFIIALIFSMGLSAHSQSQEQDQTPATKLEEFQAKTGIVIIRGYSTVGQISGLGGVITVDAREFRDASSPNIRTSGVSITVKETTRLERESTSFIDADEIESLLEGLDYISQVSSDVTKLNSFEVEYRTNGGFRVVVFNTGTGQLSVAVTSGRVTRTSSFINLNDLQKLKELIISAQALL